MQMFSITDGSGKMDTPEVIEIPIWNGTVANLTLMALVSISQTFYEQLFVQKCFEQLFYTYSLAL